MHCAAIVGHVPAACIVLGKTCDIATVGVHQLEVSHRLKKAGGELGVGIDCGRLGLVGVQVSEIPVAAGCKGSGSKSKAHKFCKYIFHFVSSELEIELNVETKAPARRE